MRKFLPLLLCLLFIFGLATMAYSAEDRPLDAAADFQQYMWEILPDMSVFEQIKLEKRNYKLITAMQPIFDADSYTAYNKAITKMKKAEDQEAIDAAIDARNRLIQIDSVEDRIWFLWEGGTMPLADGENFTEEELDASQMDAYGQEPLIIKYLLDEPGLAKGNIIICSGGSMIVRSNGAEGYPACEVFNELGYNCFLLQRRVSPYSREDIFMDFQRSIRLVKHHAALEGWGGQDMIAGLGFSGGSSSLIGSICTCYGYRTPADEFDTDYVPDDIDAVNSDLDAALLIYGATTLEYYNEDNSNWPVCYMCAGTEDETDALVHLQELQEMIEHKVPTVLNVIDGAPHGFGVGLPPANGIVPGSELWPYEADTFMQEYRGYQNGRHTEETSDEADGKAMGEAAQKEAGEHKSIDFPEASEDYVKAKTFYGYYILMDSDVVFALNADETRFAVKFNGIGGRVPVYLEGDVHEDGTVKVDDTFVGLFGEDVQMMYEDALEDPADWVPISR